MHPLILSVIVLVPTFLLGWWFQQRQQNAGWVDVMWAFGVAIVAILYLVMGEGDVRLRCLTGIIYGLWFGRLGWHLAHRIAQDKEEDGRYAYLRQWAGSQAPMVFCLFYLMQASWVWLFTLPAWLLAQGNWPGSGWAVLAVTVALIAWAGEALSDRQLQEFKSDAKNRGKTCRNGLWRYSRHPNYFFEWCHWFVYPLLGVATVAGGWLWLAPPVMFLFLYFVTGIPFTEQQALRTRGEDYRAYQQSTSMFFPWKPRTVMDSTTD